MKATQKGFGLAEILAALAIGALVIGGATQAIYSTGRTMHSYTDYLTAVHNVDTATHWLSGDVRRADRVITTGLIYPDLLTLQWTEWNFSGDSVYHSVTYSLVNVTGQSGDLKRSHQVSTGGADELIVGHSIYYSATDPDHTTQFAYGSGKVDLRITASSGESLQSGDFSLLRRANFRGN